MSGIGSVPPDVLGRARTEVLPRPFEMMSAGQLRFSTQTRRLADVEGIWTAAEPSRTRVVLQLDDHRSDTPASLAVSPLDQ